MPLIPCESCRRHVRAADPQCPFCKTTRAPSALVAVAAASAIMIAGCDTFSPASKYGGPPGGYTPPESSTSVTTTPPDAGVVPVAPTASSPRLGNNPDEERVVAPVAKYGGPPRK